MRQAVFHVYYTLKQFDIVQTPIVSYDGRQLLHTKEFVKWIQYISMDLSMSRVHIYIPLFAACSVYIN